jgi:hypothetical protein
MSRPAKDLPALRPGDHLAAAGGFKKRGLPLPALWPKHKGNPGNRKPPGHPSFSFGLRFRSRLHVHRQRKSGQRPPATLGQGESDRRAAVPNPERTPTVQRYRTVSAKSGEL